jgi:hypothetical protein
MLLLLLLLLAAPAMSVARSSCHIWRQRWIWWLL